MLLSHYVGRSSSCKERVVTMQTTLPGKLWERNSYTLLLNDFQAPGGGVG